MRTQSLLFIGSYAEADTPGVYACHFDEEAGTLRIIDQVDGLANPTFLDVDAVHNRLYAISAEADAEGNKRGQAAAYTIDPQSGTMQLINKEDTVAASTCHITLDHTQKHIIVSSYHGGMLGVSPIMDNGAVGPIHDVHHHTGSSVHPAQTQARVHSVFLDHDNQYAVACDLGTDRIHVYRFDASAGTLTPHSEVEVAAGAGPRHFVFHPSLPKGYVINELNATVTAFDYDTEKGQLHEIQTISTLPADYKGENGCADIHISPDGKFLYGSNRGHDSIVVYAIDQENGKLSVVEYAPAGGEHPRNFALTSDGRFVLVANRDTNNIVVYRRDADTGKLQSTGHELEVSKPVCIKFYDQK